MLTGKEAGFVRCGFSLAPWPQHRIDRSQQFMQVHANTVLYLYRNDAAVYHCDFNKLLPHGPIHTEHGFAFFV